MEIWRIENKISKVNNMLKDIIKKRYKELFNKKSDSKEFFPFKLRGEIEVIGKKNGEVFHYDKGDNAITIWGKHAVMHLLTGDVFSSSGVSRSTSNADHIANSVNNDGTLLSGNQYFDSSSFPGTYGWWSNSNPGLPSQPYSYFPVKMLFGTGFEFSSWSAINDNAYTTFYTNDGFTETNFNANISNANNIYSNIYSGGSLTKTKTINDIYAQALTTPAITEEDFGISGAIKDGLYNSITGDSANLETIDGNQFLRRNFRGIGRPSFIYAKRNLRFYQNSADISLGIDDQIENKITFTASMPEQTGVNSGFFYPYNGFTLKEIGLFCDSFFTLKNTVPVNAAASDDTNDKEFENNRKMSSGILFAKRYIAPITKRHDVSIISRWSIFL